MSSDKPVNRIITGQYPVVGMRRAKLVDIPVLKSLIEQSLEMAGEGQYTPRQIESALAAIGRVDEHLIEDGTLYAATSGGEIVGIGGWSSRKARYTGDPTAAAAHEKLDPAATTVYLRCYYVKPHWTRMGVGSALLDDSLTAARQAGFRHFEVLSTPMSLPFFKARGFEVKEETEIALPDGVKLPVTHLALKTE